MSSRTEPSLEESLRGAARRYGTPLFVTDLATLDAACAAVRDAFPDPIVRQYSVKANDVPAVIAQVAARGFGANVVSRGEWALARRAGVPNERITLEGVGKTPADLRDAARAAANDEPLRWVAIESPDEAEALALAVRRAKKSGSRLDVLYRLNPDVAPETHAGLAVGSGAAKFGMTETEIGAAIEAGGGPDGPLRPRGIHLHVGSQLGAVDAWRDAVRKALALAALWRGSIDTFDTVDLGGGFPVLPLDQPSPSPERFARELPALLDSVPEDRRPSRLAIEPGRALVARAGWLVGARAARARARRSPGRPRRRHDRADPPGALRGAAPDRGARPRSAATSRAPAPSPVARPMPLDRGSSPRASRARSASPPIRWGPRPAAAPPRRPRGDRRRRRLRDVPGFRLQRPTAAPAGPARHRRHPDARPAAGHHRRTRLTAPLR